MIKKDQEITLAIGGKGGLGNSNFKSSTNQAPRRFTYGGDMDEKYLWLSLKLFADIGIIGKPNAGKSTLLTKISKANPKVAAYPFTTLHPVLGVLRHFDDELILADIPGLIKGAHEGKGLGDQFLAHIERCKVLLHIIDCSEQNVYENYLTIHNELKKYDKKLVEKKELIALSKIDLVSEDLKKVCIDLEKKTGIKPILFSNYSKEDLNKITIKLFKESN